MQHPYDPTTRTRKFYDVTPPMSTGTRKHSRFIQKVFAYTVSILASLALLSWLYHFAYERYGWWGVIGVFTLKAVSVTILIYQYIKENIKNI